MYCWLGHRLHNPAALSVAVSPKQASAVPSGSTEVSHLGKDFHCSPSLIPSCLRQRQWCHQHSSSSGMQPVAVAVAFMACGAQGLLTNNWQKGSPTFNTDFSTNNFMAPESAIGHSTGCVHVNSLTTLFTALPDAFKILRGSHSVNEPFYRR